MNSGEYPQETTENMSRRHDNRQTQNPNIRVNIPSATNMGEQDYRTFEPVNKESTHDFPKEPNPSTWVIICNVVVGIGRVIGRIIVAIGRFCWRIFRFLVIKPICWIIGLCKAREIPQGSFVDIEEDDYPKEIIYRQAVARNSSQPYVVKFSHPTRLICGIAVIPKDENTAFPEVKILQGGVGYNFVDINLKPLTSGYWACGVEILSRKEMS